MAKIKPPDEKILNMEQLTNDQSTITFIKFSPNKNQHKGTPVPK